MSQDLSKLPPSERYKAAHPEHCDLYAVFQSLDDENVLLTQEEIDRGRAKKREIRKKAKTFVNTPIYRAYHHATVLLLQIVQLMPKKTVKISDAMLQYLSESVRWAASAYEQKNEFLKQNSLGEAISLMYTTKICVNSASSLNLIGKNKSAQLSKSIDTILRQLVAWRVSLEGLGSNEK